jgi:hypothetical protein
MKNSGAQEAFIRAFTSQIICGVGYFRLAVVETEYDVFNKDIVIEPVYNPHSIIFDPESTEVTGADARRVTMIEQFTEAEFKRNWPKQNASDVMLMSPLDTLNRRLFSAESQNRIRIASMWEMDTTPARVALLKDLTTADITDMDDADIRELVAVGNIVTGPEGPMIRDTVRPIARLRTFSGNDFLEDPVELPISRVPVFRMTGNEVFVGEDRVRWGMVRFIKDPQRLHNYWRSAIANTLSMSASRPPIIASADAISGREDEWREWWTKPVVMYNSGVATPPQVAQMPQINPALYQEALTNQEDMKEILNMHNALLGQQSNEVSGRAIAARQRIGEMGNAIYTKNADLAQQECGRVMNELTPHVYDTHRIVTTLGREESVSMEEINAISDPNSRITTNKYRVTVTTGVSYATRRQEALDVLLTAMNHNPEASSVFLDKVFDLMDTPETDEIADRIRSQMPPGTIKQENMTEEEQQAAAQAAEQAAKQAKFAQDMAQADLDYKRAQADEALARARQAVAQAEKVEAETQKTLSEIGTTSRKLDIEEEKVEVDKTKIQLDAIENEAEGDRRERIERSRQESQRDQRTKCEQ